MPEKLSNLESLRHVLGNDEAAEFIGSAEDRKRLKELLANPQQVSRQDVIDAMCHNFSGEAYGSYQYVRAIYPWGDEAVMAQPPELTIYGTFLERYPQLANLSLDPGFLTHLPEVMALLFSKKVPAQNFAQTREKLSRKLGNTTVYRGTMLTPEELVNIEKFGMISPLARYMETSSDPINDFAAKVVSANLSEAIQKHFHGETQTSQFLSVSTLPDVATAVGRHYADKTPDRQFYLFEMKVPVLDVLFYTPHGIRTPSALRRVRGLAIAVDGREQFYPFDQNVESFLFWKINPSDITKISQPDVTTSEVYGTVTHWK